MIAARLYGPADLRIDEIPMVGGPGPGEVAIRVTAVGICGSDLHTYNEGRIGTTRVETPLVLGHEFGGTVSAVGDSPISGSGERLSPGMRVAVDPHVPCRQCEMCQRGHPNLCPHHKFYGVWPHDGALVETMVCDAQSCFPVPDSLSDVDAALLEPLGVALHAVDLGKIRVGDTVTVLGCGPIGLLVAQLARLAGAATVLAFDPLDWRAEEAVHWGASGGIDGSGADAAAAVGEQTRGRGADVVFEVAWAGASVQSAVEAARPGGRVVLVGIPEDDRLELQHSTARRKGLTLSFARRMKHTYPRAIGLADGQLELERLVTHRFPLERASEGFAMNAGYRDGVMKAVILP
ncbi:MAG: alcohol dehydrogenase catalytic domain-containing protein [Trueperaceae bacterium]